LGIQLAGERHVYADELEYAAALLGTTPERLGDIARKSAAVATVNAAGSNLSQAEFPVRNQLVKPIELTPFPSTTGRQSRLFVRLAAVAGTLLLLAGLVGYLIARLR
jgi:hypothetical protein